MRVRSEGAALVLVHSLGREKIYVEGRRIKVEEERW